MNNNTSERLRSSIEASSANRSIEQLEHFFSSSRQAEPKSSPEKSLLIYSKSEEMPKINYRVKKGESFDGKNHNILIIDGPVSPRLTVNFLGLGSIVYIGGDVGRKVLRGRLIVNRNSSLFVGSGVTATDLEINVAGVSCVVGDDCMMARGVNIRTHSGHAFFDVTSEAIEEDATSLHVEPHVWFGEHVKVFRAKHIGACSVVGYNSLLLSSMPRFSIFAGVPAKMTKENQKLWLRSRSPGHLAEAKAYYEKFCLG